MKITDKVKFFENACAVEGINPLEALPYAAPVTADQRSINAYAKLIIITRVLNEGWVPDYDNNDWKHYPWFYMRSEAAGGPGFSYSVSYCGRSFSRVGARLVFKSEELAEYAANQFRDIYEDFMVIPK
jgi:hypothetical protein